MTKSIQKIKKCALKLFLSLNLILINVVAYAQDAKDYLSTSKDMLTKNLGQGSTAWWLLLLIDLIVAIVTYIFSKNPKVLSSTFIVLIVFNVGWVLLSNLT